jgi:hypothetical protein
VTVLPASKKPGANRRLTENDKKDWSDLSERASEAGRERDWSEAGRERDWSDAIGKERWSRQETILGSDIYKGYQVCGREEAHESWNYAKFVVSGVLDVRGVFLAAYTNACSLPGI